MVRIMADTASLFDVKSGRELGISVVPLNVTIAGKTYRELEEISSQEFLEVIRQGHIPTSSQPSPGDIMAVFETASESQPVLYLPLADGLSGAYSTACGVRETMPNKKHITIINTKTLCGPLCALVKKAQKLAVAGCTVEEIIRLLRENIESSKSFLIPQDFGYLRRGGRLSPSAAHVGGLLRLVPIMTQNEEGTRLEKAGICRNFNKAVEKAIEGFKRSGVDERYVITISHADTYEQGSHAYTMISNAFHGAALELVDLTPAFIAQGGPKCVAIQAVLRN